jgi:hypothetical protein
MTPVYLPFTTLSGATARALLRYFKTLILYRPQDGPLPNELAPWLAADRIAVRVPVEDEDQRLTQALAACEQWARERDLGGGDAGAFLKAQPPGTPLYDTDAVGRLRRQILAGGRPDEGRVPRDPIFDARLFLAMAEAHDRDNESAADHLKALQRVEAKMLREMHAGTQRDARIGPPTAAIAAAEDRGAFMTGERLRAWTLLASRATDLSPLLVTDSPAVAAELLERRPGGDVAAPKLTLQMPPEGDGDHPTLQERFLAWLDQVVAADAPESLFTPAAVGMPALGEERPCVDLHLLADCPSQRLLGGLLPRDLVPRWRPAGDPPRHGVIVVLNP